jgi:glutamyl-tRNA reductase
MKVVIIGSGNVASVLGRLIKNAGHDIVQVVSRTAENAEMLAAEFGSIPCTDKSAISREADIYFSSSKR